MSHAYSSTESVEMMSPKEKKRHQNRVAQRVYRRNQKSKLLILQKAAAQAQENHSVTALSTGLYGSGAAPAKQSDGILDWDLAEFCVPPMQSEASFEPSQVQVGLQHPYDFDTYVEELSKQNLPINFGRSAPALHRAIMRADKALCTMLLQSGADIGKLDTSGKTALDLAVESGDVSLLKIILESGGCPNVKNPRGRTALFTAIENANTAMVELLLEFDVDLNCPDESGEVALHLAVELGSSSITLLLLQFGANVNA